jgi:arginyl-tRNA synthetase
MNVLRELRGRFAQALRPLSRLRDSRLLLCDLTARLLEKGLWLLGIRTTEQM